MLNGVGSQRVTNEAWLIVWRIHLSPFSQNGGKGRKTQIKSDLFVTGVEIENFIWRQSEKLGIIGQYGYR
jgi:hypothetical protein